MAHLLCQRYTNGDMVKKIILHNQCGDFCVALNKPLTTFWHLYN